VGKRVRGLRGGEERRAVEGKVGRAEGGERKGDGKEGG